ncbi:unnamed protein product [Schistosoma curassoni]|uniref:MHD domain-containing protein n=1 Tax=Schistosoma curassoni TaxID=6186 RepID=A0A183JIJ5_9TREM|nr:unnamed protein product [Schistosoma curassoni]
MDVERSAVTICDQDCPIVGGSSLALKCITPKLSTLNIKMCDVTVTVPTIDNVLQKKLIGAFKYDVDLSPRIISVDPLIGGTGGGKPRIITWTRLAKTAEPRTNKLILEHPVDWQPGEHIIITSTGGKSSHNESEEHIIQGNLMNYAINLDYQ